MESVNDKLVQQKLADGTYKRCPFCGQLSELISGCNYVTCVCKKGKGQKSPWCWLCGKKKYIECNDKSHNSH